MRTLLYEFSFPFCAARCFGQQLFRIELHESETTKPQQPAQRCRGSGGAPGFSQCVASLGSDREPEQHFQVNVFLECIGQQDGATLSQTWGNDKGVRPQLITRSKTCGKRSLTYALPQDGGSGQQQAPGSKVLMQTAHHTATVTETNKCIAAEHRRARVTSMHRCCPTHQHQPLGTPVAHTGL